MQGVSSGQMFFWESSVSVLDIPLSARHQSDKNIVMESMKTIDDNFQKAIQASMSKDQGRWLVR